jgi:enterochelin esterase family protein
MPVIEVPIDSAALRGNPLGDPTSRVLPVVVPDDHDPSEPIPCVWWLAGYAGVGRQMLAGDLWQEGLEARLHRLRAEGRIGPMAVALPDAFTRYGGCQYLSSPAVGDYERYLWEEAPAALAARMRILRHGVAGKSSGGFGALAAAIRHPGLIEAVACHSGDMGFEMSVFPDIPRLMNAVRDHGSLEALVDAHARAANKKDGRWFGPLSVLALAAVYGPDPSEPLGVALPFDLETGRLRSDVLERWRSFDPVVWLEASEAARATLARARLVYFDCGLHDEHHLHWGARQLADVLTRHGVPHEHEEFPGGHRSTHHRLDVSLPKLYAALR